MKQYHVYGLGNALLDISFEVGENELERLDINKGVMTLIDADREHELLELIDGIKHHRACGGSAANTLMTVAELGGKGFYSCKVANDHAGDFFYEDLRRSGLETNLRTDNRNEGKTGKCIVMITPDADRTMSTYLGITQTFSKNELVSEKIATSEYIYIEGYLVAQTTGFEAMKLAKNIARENNTKISLTLSDLNMVLGFRKELLEVLEGGIDLLFCNETEVLHFCETDNLETAQERLKSYAKQYAITLGKEGVILFDGKTTTQLPAFPVHALDTVGAGDTFAGAFLYGLTHGHSFDTAGNIANYAASQVVSRFGPRLTREEFKDVQRKIPELALTEEYN